MILFDRSWYNRALVEHVMGFCTDKQYADFLHMCPGFESLLRSNGIILVKYWFEVSEKEQQVVERRMPGDRERIRLWASFTAMDMLRRKLMD